MWVHRDTTWADGPRLDDALQEKLGLAQVPGHAAYQFAQNTGFTGLIEPLA